jgi:hypothetical protein
MKKRKIWELEWAVRKDEMKFTELVENMRRMAVGDMVEEMMNRLGLGDSVEVEEVGPWELDEDWLVQWMNLQDRLKLCPGKRDVCMKDVPDSECDLNIELEEVMWMSGEDTSYMEWLQSELREMYVDTDTIYMVMYN